MSDRPLLPGRAYWLKMGAATVPARVSDIRHKVNVDTGEELAAATLTLNDIGRCTLALDAPVAFEPYAVNRDLGGFILIDRMTNETAAAGMIRFALRRSANVRPQALSVSRADRAALKRQSPLVLWFTGLSGAGKSTIANRVEQRLNAEGLHTVLLDGDNIRHGLNRDLGFTDADRVENIRRVAEVARLMTDAGLIVLVSFISPFRDERRMARERMEPGEFVEIFVDTPLEVAEARDVKGLYAKARSGQLANFTGIDSAYEPPETPELRIDAAATSPEDAAEQIMALIHEREAR
jgi:bifunctional enzyme CysN/CysC